MIAHHPLPLLFALLLFASASPVASPESAAASAPSVGGGDYRIDVRNFSFQPAQLLVPIGARVTWTNHDEEPHIVVSVGNHFGPSPALDTDAAYTTVFQSAGTYVYFCTIHPQMTGSVVVR
ncbi:cupredoxin domain-containing protein [Dokdonella soli]|uniref:EfeO-type cupredoxin-like domain-containing protein n=1 Tax=Dokdonella soli TaxID=529810 RepID=A0ABN1IFK2_9GAMM